MPEWVTDELFARLKAEPPTTEKLCRGTLLSWDQYEPDIEQWGYIDARLKPWGEMTAEEIREWTESGK